MKMRYLFFIAPFLLLITFVDAQTSKNQPRALKEDLPPTVPELYSWWNLLHYAIEVTPDYNTKTIVGANTMKFKALRTSDSMQIELQDPMLITSITWKGAPIPYKNEKGIYILHFPREIRKGEVQSITIAFEGAPKESVKPPYDNGWIWAKDLNGRPFISVACEGSGASIWLPCKDVLYDKPDNGVSFSITVPDTLTAIANGRCIKKSTHKQRKTTYTWKVVNPINNYNIIPYIGKYVSWHEDYAGAKGKLDCDYWVLDYNLIKAKSHLKQTDTLLRAFEYWFGPYPFYEDSYKVVEAPMSGMEHQSALAYGNGFQNGLRGKDIISGSGWGLKWDFILVHESGHEWFGNSITSSNHNDTWIHEGFAKYAECLYTDFVFGKQAGYEYTIGIRKRIKNDAPVIGSGSSDQYYKGSVLLHSVRQIIGDTAFRQWLLNLNKTFYHQTVNTKQVIDLLNRQTKKNYSKLFEQYLTTIKIPALEYTFQNMELEYRWANCVDGFDMPIKISFGDDHYFFIYPTTKWQNLSTSKASNKGLTIDNNFYVTLEALKKQ
jgi:aminopeptidase N